MNGQMIFIGLPDGVGTGDNEEKQLDRAMVRRHLEQWIAKEAGDPIADPQTIEAGERLAKLLLEEGGSEFRAAYRAASAVEEYARSEDQWTEPVGGGGERAHREVLELLREVMEVDQYAWFERLEFHAMKGGTVRLAAPSELVLHHIKKHYPAVLKAAWREVRPETLTVDLVAKSLIGRVDDVVPVAELPDWPVNVQEIGCRVKWFDASKGYGFVTPDNGDPDVLLRVTSLRAAGYDTIFTGSRMHALTVSRGRRREVFRIVSVDDTHAIHPSQLPQLSHVMVEPESDWAPAMVKWFNRVRGFGFLTRGEGTPDIFVHMDTLRRFGFTELRPGQILDVRWGHGYKGCMAAEMRPASAQGRRRE